MDASPQSLGSAIALAFFGWMLFQQGRILVRNLSRAYRARSWPRVPGRLIEARVGERRAQGATFHVAEVVYGFEAAGRSWTGNNIVFGDPLPATREKAEAQVRALLDNPSPEVVFNPGAPEISALQAKAGVYVPALWVVGAGILFVLFAYILSLPPE
ncbi:MAG: DUF3592 domain-containing protein [Alphaproteobacteria bacterium]|nr:DUF3592 domain-containing protein [Alphaproteobacteria bacterium]MBF0335368.1 DUF3592 domain-containing protein [Alphaproteobacteria bacterium]